MTTAPLFYKKVVPLNKEQHRKLYIETVEGFGFARQTNSLYIAAVEFANISREYPIVFGNDSNGGIFPVVLLGLKNNQNLFINGKGAWKATYIPAYVRRYPFILASTDTDAGQFTVCIDEAYTGFNTAEEGQALFDETGEHTPMLQQAVDFLKDYQNHVQLTTAFCQNMQDLDLLEPMQATIEMRSGEKLAIGGFQCVNRKKLIALQDDKMADLVKNGQMELIYTHLLSMNNVTTLMNMLN
ncbi:MAG: SapC family protein [Proteobacteria bacterium]|nr:SapC family protein [Pseudomonadota bacterium]